MAMSSSAALPAPSRLSRLGYIDTHHTADPVRRRIQPRGVPPSLQDHPVFLADEPAEAAALIGKALAPCRLVISSFEGFAAQLHGIRLRDLSMLYLDLHESAALDIGRSGAYYAVHMAMSGSSSGTVGGRPVDINAVTAMVTNPYDPLLLHFEPQSPQLIIRIEQASLERYLTRLVGHTLTHALVFDPVLDLSTDAATRWHGGLQLLHTEVIHSGSLLHAGIGIGAIEELLMGALLMLQPSTYREAIAHPATRPGRRTVRHALDYIDAHLRETLSMDDIAEHAGASVRTVQQGFHDELGLTPMAYLRERRLERVREELTDAIPADGVTVTEVAAHWGFSHLSSFAGLYRKRWGESPSATLRR